jgi:uncharacterized membrane protein YcaP (DUF421 family)
MNSITELFGSGKELDVLQMVLRALVIFIIALVLIRFSGRRSFGMNTPFDNVIAILLGSILSRAVTGASPFWPIIAASTVIVVFYRLLALISVHSHLFGSLIKGEYQVLYRDGEFIKKNMEKSLISEKDLMEGIRLKTNSNSLEPIKEVYVERGGKISVILKKS